MRWLFCIEKHKRTYALLVPTVTSLALVTVFQKVSAIHLIPLDAIMMQGFQLIAMQS